MVKRTGSRIFATIFICMIIIDEYFYKIELKYWLVVIFSYQYSMYEWLERHTTVIDKQAKYIEKIDSKIREIERLKRIEELEKKLEDYDKDLKNCDAY